MMFGLGGMWIWIVILAGVVFFVAWSARGGRAAPGEPESPEQILKRRFARGEIDREQYRRQLDELRR